MRPEPTAEELQKEEEHIKALHATLLHCPFCGAHRDQLGIDEIIVNMTGDRWATNGRCRYEVWCACCACRTGHAKNPDDAVRSWNTRLPPRPSPFGPNNSGS